MFKQILKKEIENFVSQLKDKYLGNKVKLYLCPNTSNRIPYSHYLSIKNTEGEEVECTIIGITALDSSLFVEYLHEDSGLKTHEYISLTL